MSQTVDVLYEDNHLYVVNKPALLPTMGVDAQTPSLITLAKDDIKRRFDKPGNVYLGVVSRLDSFTSGVLVLARTSKAASRLSAQFQQRTSRKFYLCATSRFGEAPVSVSPRDPAWNQFPHCWKDWIWHDDAGRRMRCQSPAPGQAGPAGAKQATLNWRPLLGLGSVQINLVQLVTGRKHQIRAQFSSRDLPVVGDRKYASPATFSPGIALHSWLLELEHPVQKNRLRFHAPLPDSWQKLGIIRQPEPAAGSDCIDFLDQIGGHWSNTPDPD